MKNFNKTTFLLLLFLSSFAFSQKIEVSPDVEFKITKETGEDFRTIPMGTQGVLTILNTKDYYKGNVKKLELFCSDLNLERKWSKSINISHSSFITHHFFDNLGDVFLMLCDKKLDYTLLKIDPATGDVERVKFNFMKDFIPENFSVINNQIFVVGSVLKQTLGFTFNFYSPSPILLSAVNYRNALSTTIYTDAIYNRVSIVINNGANKGNRLMISTYTDTGDFITTYSVLPKNGFQLNSGEVIGLDANTQLLMGTYTSKALIHTQGIYSVKLANNEVGETTYNDFGTFSEFFNYLRPNAKSRMLAKIEKKNAKNKIKKLDLKVFVHPIQIKGSQILFTVEPYYTQTNRNYIGNMYIGFSPLNYNTFLFRGSPSYMELYRNSKFKHSSLDLESERRNYKVIKFIYQSAFTVQYDLKDQSILGNTNYVFHKTEGEIPVREAAIDLVEDRIWALQQKKEGIYYSNLQNSSSLKKEAKFIEQENLLNTYSFTNGGIINWYEGVFLASGVKTIRDQFDPSNNRKIYFLKRIEVHPRYSVNKED